MKNIQIVKCSGNLWYQYKTFPINTYVNEATIEKGGESYNAFFCLNNVEDFYYSKDLHGFIAKEDCVDVKTAESHYYTIVDDKIYDKGVQQVIKFEDLDYSKTSVSKELFCESMQNNKIKFKANRVFESGAQRDNNTTKPFCHNLKGYTRLRFGYHMTKGSNKYGDANWEKGMPSEQYIESMDRHWSQYISGDRSEDHLSAFMFGINGLMDNDRKDGIKSDHYFKLIN